MAYRTVVLKGDPIRKEIKAGGAITPGHLVERNTSGNVVVHPTAGGNYSPTFAIEDSLQGKEITDAYATNNRVQVAFLSSGMEVAAILTTSQTIVIGDLLESAGNGTVRKHTVQAADSVGALEAGEQIPTLLARLRAIEAVTTTVATARIACEVV